MLLIQTVTPIMIGGVRKFLADRRTPHHPECPDTRKAAPVRDTGAVARVDPAERVLNLLTLLHESATPLTRAEIASRMRTGATPYPDDSDAERQAFTSDRRTIVIGLGVVIRERVRAGDDAGRTEYWIEGGDLLLPDLSLDDEERLLLAIALAAVSRRLPGAGEALLKLGPPGAAEGPFEFNVDVPEDVTVFIDAARRGAVVEVAVTGGRFEFEPWAVMLDSAAWLAIGHDVAIGAPRAIRIDRLRGRPVDLDHARTAVRPPLDTTLLRRLARTADDSEPVRATVLVDEITAARASLSSRVHHVSQVDLFGAVELDVAVGDRAGFRGWLLALGERAEVVGPKELRDETVAWLQAIAECEPSGVAPPPRPKGSTRRPGPEPVEARLHRLLAIVPWLYQQGSARIDDIAARVGVSADQVVRDLTVASMCGLPPYTSDVLYGFWVDPDEGLVHVINPTLLTDRVRLTARQATAVGVALSALDALPGGRREVSERLRAKLDDAVGDVPVRIAVDEPPLLDDVRLAVERHERIRIEYVDLDDNLTERAVDPHKMFVDRGTAYVLTDDHLRQDQRVFRVDRIVSLVPTGERFEPRRVQPPAGVTWEWMVPAIDVVVRLPPGNDWVLEGYATSASLRDDDGALTVWLEVVSERWLAALLLRCGAGAEVLAPERFVDLPMRSAKAALARYA